MGAGSQSNRSCYKTGARSQSNRSCYKKLATFRGGEPKPSGEVTSPLRVQIRLTEMETVVCRDMNLDLQSTGKCSVCAIGAQSNRSCYKKLSTFTGGETQPLRRTRHLCTLLDCLVTMKCQQNLVVKAAIHIALRWSARAGRIHIAIDISLP